MKKPSLVVICGLALLFCSAQLSITQTKKAEQSQNKLKIVALNTNELEALSYDAGKVKFITSSEDTSGAYAIVELTEMPGYKTAWHQHNNCEEAFYVVEGVLTIKLVDKTYEFPAGSYVLIPRGTPHGQGNFTKTPVRLLTTFTPGGFDQFFRDRVELFKTVKPGDPTFQQKFDKLREKHRKWVEILGAWDMQK
jgi:quercetin dioxygenase-like cupin family protein